MLNNMHKKIMENSLLNVIESVISDLKQGAMFDAHTVLKWIEKEHTNEYNELVSRMEGKDLSHTIGRQLAKIPTIEKVDKIKTENILGNESENTLWRKR